MTGWKEVLKALIHDAENQIDDLKYGLDDLLGGPGKITIVPYRGFGRADKLYIKGRVLEDKGIPPAGEDDRVFENLINMYKRFESDEIRYARLAAEFQGQIQEIQADEEGMFEVEIEPQQTLDENLLWQKVNFRLLEPQTEAGQPVTAVGEVLIPPKTAQYVVISDIDDTVLKTDATSMLNMVRHVFLGNARSRLPFPGVAAFYRALLYGKDGHAMNPLFYVSSSPWNIYDLLVEFFHLQDIPIGPILFLREWGVSREELLPVDNFEHKLGAIRRMLAMYPELPFILIGDSGQQDPEIYAQVVRENRDRILAVYIRNVSRDLDRPEAVSELAEQVVKAGSVLILADDTYTIARHAVEKGWIQEEALAAIQGEKEKDEKPTAVEELIPGEEKQPGPTVTVQAEPDEANQVGQSDVIEDVLSKAGKEEDRGTPNIIVKGDKEAKDRNPSE